MLPVANFKWLSLCLCFIWFEISFVVSSGDALQHKSFDNLTESQEM